MPAFKLAAAEHCCATGGRSAAADRGTQTAVTRMGTLRQASAASPPARPGRVAAQLSRWLSRQLPTGAAAALLRPPGSGNCRPARRRPFCGRQAGPGPPPAHCPARALPRLASLSGRRRSIAAQLGRRPGLGRAAADRDPGLRRPRPSITDSEALTPGARPAGPEVPGPPLRLTGRDTRRAPAKIGGRRTRTQLRRPPRTGTSGLPVTRNLTRDLKDHGAAAALAPAMAPWHDSGLGRSPGPGPGSR